MEQLREVAMAYYQRSSAKDKQLAHQVFSVLDRDGDGRVSLAEYKKAVGSNNSKLFAAFDQNGDGNLDFQEFLTLHYMNKVGLRKCDGCAKYLFGSYFSCVMCERDSSFDLCSACYGGGAVRHHHSDENFFDDRSMRLLLLRYLKQERYIAVTPSSRVNAPPLQQNSNIRDAIKAFEVFYEIGNAVFNFGSIGVVTGCIVM